MQAFGLPDARDRVDAAVDALVDESIDDFSTDALGEDLIDIRRRRSIDSKQSSSVACIALIARMERSQLAG